jgi:hypothetical protein
MKSLTESNLISTKDLDYSKMPLPLVNRQDQQGKVVQWLWDWRGRNTGMEEFPEAVGEIYERLISIWEDLQNPDKISDSNVRREHAAKWGISLTQALKDYHDSFLYHSFESPEFKKGYKQRNLERYERLYSIASAKEDVKMCANILEKIDNLLQLQNIEDGDKDLREKLKARVTPMILTPASEKLIEHLTQSGGVIDLSNIQEIPYEEVKDDGAE